MLKRLLPAAALTLAAALLGTPSATSSEPARIATPKNVVLLMIDDATVEDIAYMPNVQSLLVQQGTTFSRNYSPLPLCCPARATTLTGQYPHNTQVLDNVAPIGGASVFDDSNTIATYLNDDYDTAIIGKYLNDFDTYTYVPPGWDTWRVAVRGVYNYLHQTVSFDGRLRRVDGYVPTVYGEKAQAFITRAAQPYFAFVSWVAPHVGGPHETADDPPSPYVDAQYRDTYGGPLLPLDDSYNESDVSDKRQAVQSLPLLTSADTAVIKDKLAQRRESLRSVDDQIGAIVATVTALGQLDNTYFMLVSDNGFMQGQHRIPNGKSEAYEPSSRVPLVIRGPGFPAGATYDKVTGLQDLTPTILSMTHQWRDQPLAQIDGVSLLSLVRGQLTTDRPQVIEIANGAHLSDNKVARGVRPSREQAQRIASVSWKVRGIVTSDGWKYTFYPRTKEVEMYDLNTDPYEQDNLAGRRQYATEQSRLEARYRKYRACDGAGCQ